MNGRKMNKNTYAVKIDGSKSLESMLEAGNYDWVPKYIINGHIPIEKQNPKEVELELTTFDLPWISHEKVLEELENQKLRPATFLELLSFGAAFPEIQREFPIAALGTVKVTGKKITDGWDTGPGGYHRATCLRGSSTGRSLNLYLLLMGWHLQWRFLTTRIV